jgi:peptidoglycan-N-acetylglucosamine deacetylase
MVRQYQLFALSYLSVLLPMSFESGTKEERVPEGHAASIRAALAAPAAKRHSAAPYTIYLTFDDGPCAGSDKVNALCTTDTIPINVFLIGQKVYASRNSQGYLHNYESNPLIEVGNHSYTHANLHYKKYFQNPTGVVSDFDRNKDSLHFENSFVRLPGRNYFRWDSLKRNDNNNGKEAADLLASKGYTIWGWDLEWIRKPIHGLQLHTGEEMLNIVDKMIEDKKTFQPDRIIILLHDPELKDSLFLASLQDFIQRAKADGRFQFAHLSEY